MSHLRLIHSVASCPALYWRFRSRDLLTLHEFMRMPETHGYARAVVDAGSGEDVAENGGYVLLYRAGNPWAEWGIARIGESIAVWECASGADAGLFQTMQAALEYLRCALPSRARQCDHVDPPLVAFR